MYKSLYYNLVIDQPILNEEPYSVMLVGTSGNVAEMSRGEPLKSSYSVNEIGKVADLNRRHILPPFVHYSDNICLDILFNGCGVDMSGKVFTSKQDALNIITEEIYAQKSKTCLLYNLNIKAEFLPALQEINNYLHHKGWAWINERINKKYSFAVFADNLRYGVFSYDVLKALALENYKIHDGIFIEETFCNNFDNIIKYLIVKKISPFTDECYSLLTDCKKYGIGSLLTSSEYKTEAALKKFIESKTKIKMFYVEKNSCSKLFPEILKGESIEPISRIKHLNSVDDVYSIEELISIYTASRFNIEELPGIFKENFSCDYLLTKGSIKEYIKANLDIVIEFFAIKDAPFGIKKDSIKASEMKKTFKAI